MKIVVSRSLTQAIAPALLILLLAFVCAGQRSSAPFGNTFRWVAGSTYSTTTETANPTGHGFERTPFFAAKSRPNCTVLHLVARCAADDGSGFTKITADAPTFDFASFEEKPRSDLKPLASFRTGTQQAPAPAAAGADEAQELAKKLANPVAALISLPLQSNFDFGMGAGSGWKYTLNVQPVIPIKLNDKWNLISRTIVPLIHQSNIDGSGSSESGLGDITQSLFFSPNKSEPFIWAVGPVALIPTATDRKLGTGKWGLGPTVLVLKQKQGWTYGVLANHIWSVAGHEDRSSVSSTFLQPFLSYSNKQGWTYGINTESTYDWVHNSWSIPIIPSISKLVRFGKQPMSFGGGVKCWVTTPSGGPENCGVRIIVTALFPKK